MARKEFSVSAIDECVKYFGTITNFSKKIGVSRQSVYNWKKGIRTPNLKKITKIEEATKGHIKTSDFFKNSTD